MRSTLKIVAINALILFVLINAILWILAFGNSARKVLKEHGLVGRSNIAREAKLPNYDGVDWAKKHFEEYREQESKYKSFVDWQRAPYAGETINISGPYGQRRTVGPTDPDKPTAYFFGGSTMWGVGADDATTIPSAFSKLTGFNAENFGDIAFTSHQSLVLLIQLLQDGKRPDIVVFYDGVNEVAHKCRAELTPWSNLAEPKLTEGLELRDAGSGGMSVAYLFSPLWQAIQSLARQLPGTNIPKHHYECHSNKYKAEKIAANLIEDWETARVLVESYGGKFYGILQPVAYFSDTRMDHLGKGTKEGILAKQFEAVYPVIQQKMRGSENVYDFVDVMDHPEYIYIDFCHVSPNGNAYVAKRLADIVAADQTQRASVGQSD